MAPFGRVVADSHKHFLQSEPGVPDVLVKNVARLGFDYPQGFAVAVEARQKSGLRRVFFEHIRHLRRFMQGPQRFAHVSAREIPLRVIRSNAWQGLLAGRIYHAIRAALVGKPTTLEYHTVTRHVRHQFRDVGRSLFILTSI